MSPRGILGTMILLAAAAGSWLLIRSTSEQVQSARQDSADLPGYYLKDAAILGTGDGGDLLYRIEADDIRHLPGEDRVALTAVRIRYNDGTQMAWSATAQGGSIDGQGANIQLVGEVRLRSENPEDKGQFLIETSVLDFQPRRQFASTADAVRITRPGVVLTAQGMEADLNREVLKLNANVSGRFNP